MYIIYIERGQSRFRKARGKEEAEKGYIPISFTTTIYRYIYAYIDYILVFFYILTSILPIITFYYFIQVFLHNMLKMLLFNCLFQPVP